MKKTSLQLTDSQRFGSKPTPALSENGEKVKERKVGPTIELEGPQVDAFCVCDLKPGDKGSATVHFVVKSVSLGEEYRGGNPKKKRVRLELSHVEAEGDAEGEADDEDGEEEETDAPAAAEPEQDDSEATATAASRTPISVKDADLG
jgi:hypothetical protein